VDKGNNKARIRDTTVLQSAETTGIFAQP